MISDFAIDVKSLVSVCGILTNMAAQGRAASKKILPTSSHW